MSDKPNPEKQRPEAPPTGKKPYQTPELVLLGDLKELTQGGTGSVVENNPTSKEPHRVKA